MLVLSSVSPFENYFKLFTYLYLCTCVLMNLCAWYSMYVELRGHLIGISSLYVGSKEYKTARVSGKYLTKEPSRQSTLFFFSLESQTIGWYHLYSGWSLLSIQPSWKHFQSCFSIVIINPVELIMIIHPSVSNFLCCFLWAHLFRLGILDKHF